MEGCSIHERVLYHHATVAPLSMTQSHRFHPDSITTVVCNQLPVVTPFTLSRGEEAFEVSGACFSFHGVMECVARWRIKV